MEVLIPMSARRVRLIDPCRFTRSALTQVLQGHGVTVVASEAWTAEAADDEAAIVVMGEFTDRQSVVCVRRHGQPGVTLRRNSATLEELMAVLVRDDTHQSAPRDARGSAGATGQLTGRERQVLGEVSRGSNSREIAERLGIQTKTVEKHKASIYAKLRVQNQTEAVATAARAGLLGGVHRES